MKVNIYYGGRGVLDDPTLYVIQKMESVLIELRVEVHRYNIYEQKNAISMLPQTLKDVDGIILATTVEWLGTNFWMPAGSMAIRRVFLLFTCSRL